MSIINPVFLSKIVNIKEFFLGIRILSQNLAEIYRYKGKNIDLVLKGSTRLTFLSKTKATKFNKNNRKPH